MAKHTETAFAIDCSFHGCAYWIEFSTVVQGRNEYINHWKETLSHDKPPVTQLRNEISAAFRGESLTTTTLGTGDSIVEVDISLVDPNPYQTRTEISDDSIVDLADSIRELGQRVPCEGRKNPQEPTRYQLAYGHRRLAALRALAKTDAKFSSIRIVIRDLSNDEMIRSVAGENIGRQDLAPVESARAAMRLIEDPGVDLKKQEIAAAFGMKPATLSNRIRVLKSFPESTLGLVDKNKITWNALRALFPLKTVDGTILQELCMSIATSIARRAEDGKPAGETAVHKEIRQRLSSQWDKSKAWAWPLDEKAHEIDYSYRPHGEISLKAYKSKSAGSILDLTPQGLGIWGTNKKLATELLKTTEKGKVVERPELTAYAQEFVAQTILPALKKASNNGATDSELLGTLDNFFGISNEDWTYDVAGLPESFRDAGYSGQVYSGSAGLAVPIAHMDLRDDPDECNSCITGRVFCGVQTVAEIGQATTDERVRVVDTCQNFECAARKLVAGTAVRRAEAKRLRDLESETFKAAHKTVENSSIQGYRTAIGYILSNAGREHGELVWESIAEFYDVDLKPEPDDPEFSTWLVGIPSKEKLGKWLNELDGYQLSQIVLKVLYETQANASLVEEEYVSDLPEWLHKFDLANVPTELSAGKV